MRHWMAWVLVVCSAWFSGLALAEQPDGLAKSPIFALDLGAHAGQAFRLAVTPDERFVITAAHDKSVRVWDTASGQLVRRFYLPIRADHDGLIQAVALAPDGERLALGGDLRGFGNGRQRAVVVMSLRDGSILKALPGYTGNTSALAWSQDGQFLAVGTDGGDGGATIDVFSSHDWKKAFSDVRVNGRVSTIAFRRDGRFFATTFNGSANSDVFLYRPEGAGFVRSADKSLGRRGGLRAAWTADQRHFYVGGHSYFDGESLGEPNWTQGRKPPAHERFLNLRESPDGKRLYGISHSRHGTRSVLRRWSNATLAGWTEDLDLADRVADFAVLNNGSVVYVAEDGSVAAVSAEFKVAWRQARTRLALAGRPELIKVSPDGRWISLPIEEGESWREVAFNLEEPGFAPIAAVKQQWLPPRTHSAAMQVLAWQGTRNGSVNGVDFPRRSARERSLSVAVHGSEPAMVFGSTVGVVRKLSRDGKPLWERGLNSDVVAINILEGKGLVAAATDDGYLRLLRWADGATLMTFYLLAGERKWLAVADSGHYEAGIGAEDLAGWVVNRGREQMADFLPLSRFRARYQLPGMVHSVWVAGEQAEGVSAAQDAAGKRSSTTLSPSLAVAPSQTPQRPEPPATAVAPIPDRSAPEIEPTEPVVPAASLGLAASAIEIAPPVVNLRSGLEVTVSEPKVTLRFSVNTPEGAPVTQIVTRVLSQSSATRGLQPAQVTQAHTGQQEISVDLPREDAEVQLIAENFWGASAPASIRVRYAGSKPKAERGKGKLHIVAVGVSEYDNPEYRLGLAAKDAKDFAQTIQQQDGRVYSGVELTVLTDQAAGKSAVEGALGALKSRVKPEDTTMLFLAGHGINDAGGEYLYLPREASLKKLKETGVSFRLIRNTLATLPGRTLLFIDTCHSGNVLGSERAKFRHDNTAAVNELASSENNIIVFASSTGSQLSQEKDSWGNGAFTKALVEGLSGSADFSGRGRVTYKQLDAYVADRVDALTEGQQTPVTPVLQGVPDFVLAEVKRKAGT